jgi:type I restriction enzyme R subunit
VRETAPGYGDATPGGYRRRDWREYDRALCLIPRDVLDFIYATQPKEWDRLTNRPVQAVSAVLLMREARAVEDGGGTPCPA